MNDRFNRQGGGTPGANTGSPAPVGVTAPPHPRALVAVDYEKKAINQVTLVLGGFATSLLDHVYQSTSNRGGRIDQSAPGSASLFYLPLRLGEIRGFMTHFHLFGLPEDPRLVPTLTDFLPHAHGLIVTVGQTQVAGGVVDAAAAGTTLPVAVLGPATARATWCARAQVAPCHESEATNADVFPAVKALSRVMLGNLKKQ